MAVPRQANVQLPIGPPPPAIAHQPGAPNHPNPIPAGALTRVVGPADNADFFSTWLAAGPFFKNFFMEYLGTEPFVTQWSNQYVPTAMFIMSMAYGSITDTTNDDDVDTRAIAEMLAPQVSVGLIVQDPEECKRLFLQSMLSLLASRTCMAIIAPQTTSETYATQAVRDEFVAWLAVNNFYVGNPVDEDWTVVNNIVTVPNFEAAYRILFFLIFKSSDGAKRTGLGYIVHIVASVIKRGNMTRGFIDKIKKGILSELNVQVNIMKPVVEKLYIMYGGMITGENVQAVIERWTANIPQLAMRLRLVVVQAAGTGLTSLLTIAKMIKKYPHFAWDDVALIFPGEWAAFSAALTRVAGNPYYGYNQDLQEVRSTLYKSIGYIAKELMVKVDGDNNINAYQGWAYQIRMKAHFDLTIAEFEAWQTQMILRPNIVVEEAQMPAPQIDNDNPAIPRRFGNARLAVVRDVIQLVNQQANNRLLM